MTVPKGWKLTQLQDCARITSGATPKVGQTKYYGGSIPFLKIDDLTQSRGLLIQEAKTTITRDAVAETAVKVYPSGTVLVTMYGTIGAVGITGVPMAANQAIAAFLDIRGLDTYFLAHLLQQETSNLSKKAGQTTQANISGRILKGHTVAIPPLPEQKKIAAILTSVDETIHTTRETIEQTKRVKQGLMQELLTKGIGHTRFRTLETGMTLPEGWRLVAYRDVTHINQDSLGSSTDPSLTIKYIDIASISRTGTIDRVTDLAFQDAPSRARRVVHRGDILVSTVRPYLRSYAIIDGGEPNLVASTGYAVLSPVQDVEGHFIYQTILGDRFTEALCARMKGSNYPAVTSRDIGEVPLALPPLPEQKQIASILTSVDDRIQAEEEKVQELEQVKRGLMQDLLTGNVRVAV